MNQLMGCFLVLALLAVPGYQGLPTLTDSEVQAALDVGLDGNEINKVRRYCDARAGFGQILGQSLINTGTTTLGRFRATMSSNIGEIALIAYEKKRKYQPVGLEDVPAELREPAAFVSIAPLGDSFADGQVDLPSLIEHVIVRPQGSKDGAVQPLSIQTNPTYLQNLFGAVIAANTAVVSFPAQAIYEIAQNDDVEIVVITAAGERKCDINDDDIRRMFDLDGLLRTQARSRPAPSSSAPTPAATPPAAATPPVATNPPAAAAPPVAETPPPNTATPPAAIERISAGGLPPLPSSMVAPEKQSESASWTVRTTNGVVYEWNVGIRNQNTEQMNAVVTVVLRASDGTALHTAQGEGGVPGSGSTTVTGDGVVEESLATRADHWTIDVAWGELEPPARTTVEEPVAEPAPARPAVPPVAEPEPTAAPESEVAETVSVSLSVDLAAERATITNTGRTNIDLRGWELVSLTGDQRMKFVIGQLQVGRRIIVTSGARARNTPGYYLWTTRSIWDINGDPAELYDPQGNLRARTNANGSPRQ